jgi:uncharacterized surface protein with fasciclin (FAS1) repeats
VRNRIHYIFETIIVLLFIAMIAHAQEQPLAEVARLRVAHYAVDAPALTVEADGTEITEDPLVFTSTAAHVEVGSGTINLVFMEDDTEIASAEIEVEAFQDYTAALIGQMADESVQVVLIPETQLVAEIRDLETPASYAILLHGISDGPTVDFTMDGETLRSGLTFGEFDVFSVTPGPHDILVTFTEDPDNILFQNSGETPPATDLLLLTVMAGSYPDTLDVTGAVSRLPDRSVIDFLQNPDPAGDNSFETLLEAIEIAGLTETLSTEGAFTLFAPTDAAFAAVPDTVREQLFADPDALRVLLENHIVDDVFVLRDLAAPLTLTSRQDTTITLTPVDGDIHVNEQAALLFGGFPVVTNGNVIGISEVLLP